MHRVDINQAYHDFMVLLFGEVPKDVAQEQVTRARYTELMKQVQDDYGLRQGHPDFPAWVFTLVGRSPMIIEDEEGAGEHEPE
jgi:hypothetical protein